MAMTAESIVAGRIVESAEWRADRLMDRFVSV
jgi:hypothetical protein